MLSASAELRPRGARERALAAVLRLGLRLALKRKLAPDVPVAEQRRRFLQLARLTWPRDGKVEPATVGGVPGEWVRAGAVSPGSILYLHGGAYCVGSAASHRAIAAHLAQATGMPVFSADYRLAPEHPHPAAIEDAIAASRALATQGPLVLAGDSAGGALALWAARAVPATRALVLFSPWTDLSAAYPPRGDATVRGDWLAACARHYLAGATPSLLAIDFAGLAPVLIQAGSDEILREDALSLHEALERCGVAVTCEIVPRRWHVFQLHAGWLPSADAAIARAAAFIADATAPR
ncbi:MAG: alpha/beta hydrolase fold domain-containing protein [Alphaproteobacteria bacterium]|nr:alpha/beta hydrolase fold domain-containing protein [Alphaproteobacteria bacterium]